MNNPTDGLKCECGHTRPCSYHDMTPEFSLVARLLKLMDPIQRGRILCWYCPVCHREVGPGETSCCEGKDEKIVKENLRLAAAAAHSKRT